MAAAFMVLAYGQEPSFRTGVNLVLLDVSVTNSKGVPVTGLGRENFEVKEDGVRREISGFALGSEYVSLAVAVDYSGSMTPRRGALIQSLRVFVSLLQPQDEAILLTFNEHSNPITSLATAESQYPEEWPAALLRVLPAGQTSLYDAAIHASEELEQSKHERRVVIILSDGNDTASTATLKDAIAVLQSANRLVYCVGLFRPGEPDTDARALRRLAESTGGLALFDEDGGGLSQALGKVMADLRSRYVLAFRSAEAPPGATQVRRLAVTARDTAGRRLKVRARDQYRVTGPPLGEDSQ
jgi:VWFA-related protein